MATAKNKEQYLAAWFAHIQQLNTLALAANVTWEELQQVKAQLNGWVDRAAARDFAEEVKA
jgi:hypothetical protein